MVFKRKGARSIHTIPDDILIALNDGTMETANLVETLAVDQTKLLQHFLQTHDRLTYLCPIVRKIELLKKQTYPILTPTIGKSLFFIAQSHHDAEKLYTLLAQDISDIVRSWATFYAVEAHTASMNADIASLFVAIKRYANDSHFGVREVAWMAVREHISSHLDESLHILSQWATDSSENIRRFASEATRPCGVWCSHIHELKAHPEKGLPIISSLSTDSSRYVQNSVGNWLNDAAKYQPDFVRKLCQEWLGKIHPSEATKYIVKRGLRSLKNLDAS